MDSRTFSLALAGTALSYAVCHHLGLLPSELGAGPSGTRWADWLDLLVPWLVLVPAGVALWAGQVGPRVWTVFGAGVIAYASGLVLAALALAMVQRPRPALIGYVLAIAAGVTWATNAIGGGTVVFSLVVALAAVAFGWRHRWELAGVLWVGYLPAVVVLVADLVLALV